MIARYRVVQMKYWNEKIETMPKEELQALQLELLQKLVKNTYRDSKFYRERMASDCHAELDGSYSSLYAGGRDRRGRTDFKLSNTSGGKTPAL